MIRYYLLLLGLIVSLFMACGTRNEHTEQKIEAVDTLSLMVTRMQSCSRLYTSEYQLHKIVTYDDSLSLSGSILRKKFKIDLPIGQRRVAIPITAQVKAYVDLSKFTAGNIKRTGNKIEITLPDPEIVMTSTRIDHDAVKKKVSILRSNFTDQELTHIQQQGRKDMIRSLARLDIIEHARQSAARQLIPIVAKMGYQSDDVVITFRKQFTLNDLSTLIKQID